MGAIESNKLTTEAIERNKILREITDNAKQRLSDSFRNLKSSIVKRVNRTKDGVTSAEVPETALRPEAVPEHSFIRGNSEPSYQNEARRRIISEATLPESVPTDTSPASVVTEFPEWTTKRPLSGEDF